MSVLHCMTHVSEVACDVCDICAETYCESCLVFHRGPERPPICVGCALRKAGVRPKGSGARPASRRTVRQRRRVLMIALQRVAERHAAAAHTEQARPPMTLAEALDIGRTRGREISFDDVDIDFELEGLDDLDGYDDFGSLGGHDDRSDGDIIFGS